ncbi:carbohydrate ABC transporter permease [Auritidibacter ignavus]|uniref:carbohydrate ABC transporter permease n=1 Tax=Auritidibacter ignavus TaxID=678932 RepID=UPI001CB6D6A1|nr:sugar ABC transporter permease [Auritidibacter ignavus]
MNASANEATTPAVSTAAKDIQQGSVRSKSTFSFGAIWPWLFVLPAIVFLLIFDYYPFFRAIILSFQATDLFGRPTGFAGLENYVTMFSSGEFWSIFTWTLLFTILSVVFKLAIGLAIALPLSYRLKGTVFMRTAVLVPMAVSTAVGTLIFSQMFQPVVGAADQITIALGIGEIPWFTDSFWARAGVVIADVWVGISFVVLLLMASIDNISDDVREAAALDGCTGANYVFRVIIPLISPMLLFLTVTQSVEALRQFTVIHALTQGGPAGSTTTLVFDVYQQAFGSSTNDYAGAAASGLVLMVIVVILSAIQFRLSSKRVNY